MFGAVYFGEAYFGGAQFTLSWSRTAGDSLTITEGVSRTQLQVRAVGDALSIAESLTRVAARPRTAADALGISGAIARTTSGGRLAGDELTISESVSRTHLSPRGISDVLSLTASATRAPQASVRATADSVGLSGAISRTQAHGRVVGQMSLGSLGGMYFGGSGFGGTDWQAAEQDIFTLTSAARIHASPRNPADGISIAESVSRTQEQRRVIYVDAGGVGAIYFGGAYFGGASLPRQEPDVFTITDAVSRTHGHTRFYFDQLAITEAISVIFYVAKPPTGEAIAGHIAIGQVGRLGRNAGRFALANARKAD